MGPKWGSRQGQAGRGGGGVGYLLMYRCGGLVAEAGCSEGHALHDGHGGEGHPHGHITHRPDVVN